MKLKHVVLATIVAPLAIGFASCSKTTPELTSPTIKVIHNSKEVGINDKIGMPFNVQVKTDEKTSIDKITWNFEYKKADGTKVNGTPKEVKKDKEGKNIAGQKEITYIHADLLPADAASDCIIKIEVKDKNGGITSREQALEPQKQPNPEPSGELMADQKTGYLNHVGNTETQGCFDLKNNNMVSANIKEELIPTRYMINNSPKGDNQTFTPGWHSDSVHVQSGGKKPWWIKGNKTLFKKAEAGFDYEKATVKQCEDLIASGGSHKVEKCAVNDVFVAKKDAELYVIKIVKIEMNSVKKRNKGHIEFTYKRKPQK